MLKRDILRDLREINAALLATCSGLRDPNRLRVAAGDFIIEYLEEALPPDPPEDEEETKDA